MEFSRPEYWSRCLSLRQGIFPTQGSNPGLPHCRRFFTSWATRKAQEYWSRQPILSPVDLPVPWIEPMSPVSPAIAYKFFSAEPPGKPNFKNESESCSVVSDSLRFHELYSPWNSLGESTGVGSLSLLQGIFPTQGSNPGLLYCRQILYHWPIREAPNVVWPILNPKPPPNYERRM